MIDVLKKCTLSLLLPTSFPLTCSRQGGLYTDLTPCCCSTVSLLRGQAFLQSVCGPPSPDVRPLLNSRSTYLASCSEWGDPQAPVPCSQRMGLHAFFPNPTSFPAALQHSLCPFNAHPHLAPALGSSGSSCVDSSSCSLTRSNIAALFPQL